MPVLDLDRLRVDSLYRLRWIARLAIVTIVVAITLAVALSSGWIGG